MCCGVVIRRLPRSGLSLKHSPDGAPRDDVVVKHITWDDNSEYLHFVLCVAAATRDLKESLSHPINQHMQHWRWPDMSLEAHDP